jgi:hypothetical protein
MGKTASQALTSDVLACVFRYRKYFGEVAEWLRATAC